MACKIKSKTGELIGWARRYGIPLPVVVRVWAIYFRQAALHGAAVSDPPTSAVQILDRAQRQAGRMLLGFRRSVPGPAVLGELGWCTLSMELGYERASFLGRVCGDANQYVKAIISSSSLSTSSWISTTVRLCRPWCGETTPDQASSWKKLVRASRREAFKNEASILAQQCLIHHALASHKTPVWSFEGMWAANKFLYNKEMNPSESRSIARLIVGGQDLRGGDPRFLTPPSRLNCCVLCLQNGVCTAETVHHVCFECPAYDAIRGIRCISAHLVARNGDIFCLHRGAWSWRELKALKCFFLQITRKRLAATGAYNTKSRQAHQLLADVLWPA
jgi:hypothetical protein